MTLPVHDVNKTISSIYLIYRYNIYRYRQVSDPREKKLEGDAPVMGIYMGLHTPGKIRTGDPVYVGYH
uniref:Uncharacterized protein n=1 Tax=Timema monikensis TaxID=170555 RepID=A0A7R9EJ27_9NEOP|nr:unnamed protein product [Timema monikensis]